MSEVRVLATAAGPYVVNTDLDVWNTVTQTRTYPKPGDVITFDPGDMVDVESLIAIGALLAPEPATPTDAALTTAIHSAIDAAEAGATERATARDARGARVQAAERGGA